MKQAFIVGIITRTRVVVDLPENTTQEEIDSVAIPKAIQNILGDPTGYIDGDNCVELEPDEECPAGTFDED